MANFLDKAGLTYLWRKIVAKINAKKINQVEPLSENLGTGAITRLSTGNIDTTNATRGVLQTFQATATMKATDDGSYPDWDANVLMMNWDSTAGYSTQLAQRNLSGEIKVRGQNKKTWTAWRTVLDSTNIESYNYIANKGNFTGDIDATDIAVGLYALDNFTLTTPSGTKAVFGSFIQFGGLYKTQLVSAGITGKSGLLYIRRYMTATRTWSDWYEYQEEIEGVKAKIPQVQEWGNASFTYSDGFAAYNTTNNNTQEPRASKWGRVVNLTGAYKTTEARTATSSVVIGKVPSGCEPLHDVRVRQQGTGQNSYLLTISTNGNLTADRYGVATNTAMGNNIWLNISATYISKS